MSRLGGRLGEKPLHSESRLGRQRCAGSTATYREGHNDVAIDGHRGCMNLNDLSAQAPAGARRGYGDDAVDAADLRLRVAGRVLCGGAVSPRCLEGGRRAQRPSRRDLVTSRGLGRVHGDGECLVTAISCLAVVLGQKAPATRGSARATANFRTRSTQSRAQCRLGGRCARRSPAATRERRKHPGQRSHLNPEPQAASGCRPRSTVIKRLVPKSAQPDKLALLENFF